MMRPIHAVAFDLWGTLIVDDPSQLEHRIARRAERMRQALGAAGHHTTVEELRAAYRATWRVMEDIRGRGLDASSREQVDIFLGLLDPALQGRLAPADRDRIGDVYAEGLVEIPPDEVRGAREALAACRAAGTRTALVSNTGQTPGRVLRRTLRALGLDGIDVWVFSDEIRMSKPDPAIFRHVLGALGSAPHETLFVGDTPELDIAGARAAGMWMLQVGVRAVDGLTPDASIPDLTGFVAALRAMGLRLVPARETT